MRTPLKTDLVIIPHLSASLPRGKTKTYPPHESRHIAIGQPCTSIKKKKDIPNSNPKKGRYASDPCFKSSVVQFWSAGNSPFEIHFMGAKVPCQPSNRPALGTSQGTAPEEEAAAHRGDRNWFVVKAWQHGLPPTETLCYACWWKETRGIGWDTVNTFNQCTGMMQPQPEPEQQDHWHLSSLKSFKIHRLLPLNVRGGLAQWP